MRAASPPLLSALLLSGLLGCGGGSSGGGPSELLALDESEELGDQAVGMSSLPRIVPLRNDTADELEITAIFVKGKDSGDFQLSFDPLPLRIQAGDSALVTVIFKPSAPGVREADLCVEVGRVGEPPINQGLPLEGGGLPELLQGPALTLDPNQRTPLAALLELETDVATRVDLILDDGLQTRTLALPGQSSQHRTPVLGLFPQTSYTVTIEIETLDGVRRRLSPSLSLTTDPLPADFPEPDLLRSDPLRLEPGVVLFQINASTQYLVALDEQARVVWYATGELATCLDLRRNQRGLLLGLGTEIVYEFDMLGTIVQTWASQAAQTPPAGAVMVATRDFHHELFEMPSGNLLSLSRETRTVSGYPSSESDPQAPTLTRDITSDVVVEFQRDGTIVRKWSLFDVLDPRRIGYDAVGGDWSHSNGVIFDPRDNSYIVSLRHQDCFVKIDRDSGALRWILGTPDNWTAHWATARLQGGPGIEWPFHGHAPALTAAGELLVFDNGNHRASPFDPPQTVADSYSRAVIYDIDEQVRQVREQWSYGGPADELFFSRAVSDADELPVTGNIFVTDGFRVPQNPTRRTARLVEVTRTQPAEKVYEVVFDDPSGVNSYWIYRAEKLPSLYPP